MTAQYEQTRDVPLDELTPYPCNAKRGDVETIRASIERNGQYRSLVVRRVENGPLIVLAGNHTLQALAAAGRTHARCEIITCDDATARRINLIDNRAADLGEYDLQALADLIRAAHEDGDLDGTGYTLDDLDGLAEPVTELPLLGDPDDAPEPRPDPHVQPGDVWLLGPHRLLCGDSTDIAAVEDMLDGDRCDAMWTDPPYGVEYTGKTAEALTIRNDGADDLPQLLAGAFATATAALRPGAPVYVAHSDTMRTTFEAAFVQAGWLFRQNLIWVKDTLVLGRSDYHYRHEPILYGFTDAPAGSGRLGRGGDRWWGDNAQTTVLEVAKPACNGDHPTMKPVELVVRCLANSCPPRGGLVYEPFGGSGTTLIAAHTTGRAARTVELDPQYADVICRRYQTLTGDKPVLRGGGEHDFLAAP